ncbi:MAG: hypothetical protein CMO66_00025 [Verrucomicrobiales bacterium]|nr:hypothetical protein [Verrucomicrobiales bacterium]
MSLRLVLTTMAMCLLAACSGNGEKEGVAKQSGGGTPAQPKPPASAKVAPITPASWNPSAPITKAQPRLRTLKLLVGEPSREITAELAITQQQIATGMMYRESMGENEGMLFIFAEAKKAAFYMKNTKVPLTVAYLGSSGRIMELHDLEPLNETAVEAQSDLIRFVLEMPQGWFKKNGISQAHKITTERGTLMEVFFPDE